MGSIISAIYDEYEDYKYFCEKIGVEPENLSDKNRIFYEHRTELLQVLRFNSIEDYFAAMHKAEERDKQINSILDE